MSLAALDDIAVHSGTTEPIEGVVRIETSPLEQTAPIFMAKMRSVYPHDEVFVQYCRVNAYIGLNREFVSSCSTTVRNQMCWDR